ncbi:VOC family protein [Paenibacillus sp. J31TS4]|uniref:VOC family protein n=1 Tax=Paenibacillus sp. J31TS4 TaxID=2807195 RepID=UPI001B080546|nr:VOC family protein [Paenibacillus sp. J31TS4]GIP40548.1 VOC family protein [Paenibacillus sp. J31TS4]
MAKLTPYFYSEDARAQAQFYIEAMGGEILEQKTYGEAPGTEEGMKDKIIHMRFTAADVTFFIADSMHEAPGQNSYDLNLEFRAEDEARRAFAGLAEGGRVLMDLEKQFWGSLFGRVEDKFGVKWQISTEAPTHQG